MLIFAFSLLDVEVSQTIGIALFAFEFLTIGLLSTHLLYPDKSFRVLIRKLVLVLGFAIIFSLISAIITLYLLPLSVNSIVMLMSLISLLLSSFAIYSQRKGKMEYNFDGIVDHTAQKTLYIIIILSLIALVSMFIPPFNIHPVWYGLCVPFVIFIPGYYIVNTLLPKREEILFIERLGISVFLNLILTSIIAIIFYIAENNIDMKMVSFILIILTLVLILPAYINRIRKIDAKNRFVNTKTNRLLLLITVMGLLCVILVGIQVTTENLTTGNTTFVVDGIEKTANEDGYINLTSGENITSRVTVTNNEHKDMEYVMKIEVRNDSAKVLSEDKVSLKDGESKTIPVNLTMTSGRKDVQYILCNERGQTYFIRHLYVDVD